MKKYNIIYLTTYIDTDIEKIINLPYAAAGLRKKNQMIDILSDHNVSIIFVTMFSRFKKTIIKPFNTIINNKVVIKIPFFIKIPFINYIVNPIFVYLELVKENKARKVDYIILYNCVYENVIPSYIFYKIHNVKIICQYEDGWVISSSGIKGLWYKLSHNLAKNISSGAIINSLNFLDIFPTNNYFLFRGNISTTTTIATIKKKPKNKLNILFSSNIDNIRGAELLIELFESTKKKYFLNTFNFHITGKGDHNVIKKLEQSIKNYNENGGSAKYYGFVSLDKLKELHIESDILLALQKSDGKFSRYCFPSKIFEYYQYNKPIITTKISDLNSDDFFNLEFIQYTTTSLIKTLNSININYDYYRSLNSHNSHILKNKFSLSENKKNINNFLEAVGEK